MAASSSSSSSPAPGRAVTLKISQIGEYVEGRTQGYSVSVEVIEAVGLPEEIFVFQRQTVAQGSASNDEFSNVASPADLEEYPADAPADDSPFFRLKIVELVYRSLALLEQNLGDLKRDICSLLETLSQMDNMTSEVVVIDERCAIGGTDPCPPLPPITARLVGLARDPTSTDDALAGYGNGSVWTNLDTQVTFVLISNTNGEALWILLIGSSVKHNFTATTDPTTDSDLSEGYATGSHWYNTVDDELFICTDPAEGNALWKQIALRVKHNFTATTDPTATDDDAKGYAASSEWYNTANGRLFICVNASAGAAVWRQLTEGGIVDKIQVIYVGKHGSDVRDGKTRDKAKLTIGAGIAAAGTPANEAAAVTVSVIDNGTYSEDLTAVEWVNLHAPNAVLIPAADGGLALVDNVHWNIGTIIGTKKCITKLSGTGRAFLSAHKIYTAGTASGAGAVEVRSGDLVVDIDEIETTDNITGIRSWSIAAATARLIGRVGRIVVGPARAVECTTLINAAAIAELDLQIGSIYSTDVSSIGISVSAYNNTSASTRVQIESIDVAGKGITNSKDSGSTSDLYVLTGYLSGGVDAYDIDDGSNLNLIVGAIGGTESTDPGTDVHVTRAGGLDKTQTIYVSKSGNDNLDGLTTDKPKLTIAAAIAAAGTPANEAAAVALNVLDDGEYDEDLTHVSFVNVYAPYAAIKGKHLLADNTTVCARRFVNDGANHIFFKDTGDGRVTIISESIFSDAGPAVSFCRHDQGDIVFRCHLLQFNESGGFMIQALGPGAQATLELDVDEWDLGSGTGYSPDGLEINYNSKVFGRVGYLHGSTNTTAIHLQLAHVTLGQPALDLSINNLNAPTAYTVVATGRMTLRVGYISGTETIAAGADVHVTRAGGLDKTQTIYVSKSGNDNLDGLTTDKPKLTIGAAITAAGTPANEAAAVTIHVLDDGEYDEDLTHIQYVNVHAPHATIKGLNELADDMTLTVRRLINDGNAAVARRGYGISGTSRIVVGEVYSAAASAVPIECRNGTLIVNTQRLQATSDSGGFVVTSNSTNPILVVDVGELDCNTDNAFAGLMAVTGYTMKIVGRVGRVFGGAGSRFIKDVYTPAGGTFEVDLTVEEATCATALDVGANSVVRILAAKLSGTETIADGADVRVTRARRNEFAETSAPGAGDDTADGYEIGSLWWDATGRDLRIAQSVGAGAAQWDRLLNATTGGTIDGNLEIADTFGLILSDTTAAGDGVVLKGSNRFLHNFHHPTGGGAVPDGHNTFLGVNAGNFTTGAAATLATHSSYNVGIGVEALLSLTLGRFNVGIGTYALRSNTEGYTNTGVGYRALYANTIGYNNTACGGHSLTANDDGYHNAAFGVFALSSNTSGYNNAACGTDALLANTTGYSNSALGMAAGRVAGAGFDPNQTSYESVYIGAYSRSSASGVGNEIAIGYQTIGLGSNTVVLGNTNITNTYLRGAVSLASMTLTGNITMGQGKSIGIGDALERLVFDGTGGLITVAGANLRLDGTNQVQFSTTTEYFTSGAAGYLDAHWADGDAGMRFYSGANLIAGIARLNAGSPDRGRLSLYGAASYIDGAASLNLTIAGGNKLAVAADVITCHRKLALTGTYKVEWRDAALSIHSPTDGNLQYDADVAHTFETGWVQFSAGDIRVGINDSAAGSIRGYGAGTGVQTGGRLYLYTSADYDTAISNYSMWVFQDDLLFTADATAKLTYAGGTDDWIFAAPVGIGIAPVTHALHVHEASSAAAFATFTNTTTGTTATDGFLVGLGADEKGYLYNYENTDLVIGTNNQTRMTVTAAGGVGINTVTVPHGGVGAARLAIEGANASVLGPHVQFTTASDDYPLLQMLMYAHDNFGLLFDSYFDGSFRSSDNSNFRIYKVSNSLLFDADEGIAVGTPITFATAFLIESDAEVMFSPGAARKRYTRDSGIWDYSPVDSIYELSADGYVRIGAGTTNHGLAGAGNFLVSSNAEFNAYAYFDSIAWFYGRIIGHDGAQVMWELKGSGTQDQVVLGLDLHGGRQLILADQDNGAPSSKDFDHPVQTTPTLYGQDDRDPDVSNNMWYSLTHDQNGMLISTGANTGVGSVPVTIDNDIRFAPRGSEALRITGDGVTASLKGVINATTRIAAGPYAVLVTDHIVIADSDGGAFTVTLPAGVEGTNLRIINTGSSGFDISVDPNGAEEIFNGGAGVAFALTDGNSITIHYSSGEGSWW